MSGGFKAEHKKTFLHSKDYQSGLYNYEAPVPGHHLAEDRAKRFEHVDLTIEANACGHEGS